MKHALGWLTASISVVILVLSAIVMSKAKSCNENYKSSLNKPGYSPSSPQGNYKGPWDANICKAFFKASKFNARKQKTCLNKPFTPGCSDYPMHYCSGLIYDKDGNPDPQCGMYTAAGTDSVGSDSCPADFGMAYTPEQCDAPLLSSGQMFCTNGGLYDCDAICGAGPEPEEVDPKDNMWGFSRRCGTVMTTTAGMSDCPKGKIRFGTGDSESPMSGTKMAIIVVGAVLALVIVGIMIMSFRSKN